MKNLPLINLIWTTNKLFNKLKWIRFFGIIRLTVSGIRIVSSTQAVATKINQLMIFFYLMAILLVKSIKRLAYQDIQIWLKLSREFLRTAQLIHLFLWSHLKKFLKLYANILHFFHCWSQFCYLMANKNLLRLF